MTEKDFKTIIKNSLNEDIYTIKSNLICPICGNHMKISNFYVKGGRKIALRENMFVCNNNFTIHAWSFNDYTIFLLDMYEGFSRANENKCNLSNEQIT